MQQFFRAILKRYHITFFGYKKLIYHPIDLENDIIMKNMHLYMRKHVFNYLKIEKMVTLAMTTHILASATAGHGSSESYKRLLKFLRVRPVLVYLHRNNK